MQSMSFALEKARVWRYIEKTAVTSSLLKTKKDNSKDWMEKIYTWEKKICKFQDNGCKVIAKIRKMCTSTIQKKFLLVKALKE